MAEPLSREELDTFRSRVSASAMSLRDAIDPRLDEVGVELAQTGSRLLATLDARGVRIAELTTERDALASVWRVVVEAEAAWTESVDAEDLLEAATAAGLYERVLYDPAKHGDDIDAEPGEDMISVLTPLGQRLAAATTETPS